MHSWELVEVLCFAVTAAMTTVPKQFLMFDGNFLTFATRRV